VAAPLPVHSAWTGAAQVMAGGSQSRTRTLAEQLSLSDESDTVNVTGRAPME
jgi:hypothetical protein